MPWMKHHIKPRLRKLRPEQVILHDDKNNFISRSPSNDMANGIIDLVKQMQTDKKSVI